MDVREKLVELLNKANSACVGTDCFEGCKFYMENDCLYKLMADHLISNGVTVQEWISVKDRLPEPGDYVLVCDIREDWYGLWEFSGSAWYDASYQPWSIDEVTHWQYLPQPPKGE